MAAFTMWIHLVAVVLPFCVFRARSRESCPSDVRAFLHCLPKHVGSHCHFNWTNRARMIEKVRDRMKHRQKQFLRFKAPVFYFDSDWTWKQLKTEFDTYVWVAKTHEYMLHFPHNFEVLSLGTMGIITNNFWEPGGEGKIIGHCNMTCIKSGITASHRCTITWKDILEFMTDVTAEYDTEWNYVCHQVNYDVSQIMLDTNSAIPDLLYYWLFLNQIISNRPFFGIGIRKDDFIHYNCFNKDGNLKREELLMKYFVILIIAILLWLYSPILIYYFPSSEPTWINYPSSLNHEEFHPSHKSPVYFGNLIRYSLGYYIGKDGTVKSRIRRVLFVSCTFAVSFRLFFTKYCSILVVVMIICLVTSLIPDFWSIHLAHDYPTHFMNILKYPEGTFRESTTKKEYQLLAHYMKERLCLVLDWQFLKMLFTQSWGPNLFHDSWSQLFAKFPWTIHKLAISFCARIFTFSFFITSFVVYHFTPAFYFYKQLYFAIITGTSSSLLRCFTSPSPYLCCAITIIVYACVLLLVAYFMVAMMFICYLIAEVTMFTYIGVVLDPSMAFEYIMLTGAVALVLHELTKNLRENYDNLRDQIVEILENSDHLQQLHKECGSGVLERKEEQDGTFKIVLKITGKPLQFFLYHDHYGTYLSRPLLDFCIEECNPLRRKVLFMLVKLFMMTFYLLIAMWVKNVFHKEEQISSIFSIAQTISMYFVPNMLQFLADKSRFGKRDDVDFHRDVHEAIVNFIKKQ